jgi:hypothetical protein
VDADPEVHAAVVGEACVECSEYPLHLDGAAHGIEGRRKLRQEIVAGGVHDPTPVLSDASRDRLTMVRERPDRGRFVRRHEPAVADRVGGENRRQPAFDGSGGHTPPWANSETQGILGHTRNNSLDAIPPPAGARSSPFPSREIQRI